MANRLNIYACTGISGQQRKELLVKELKELKNIKFNTLNTNTLTNTQAVNSLLTRINCAKAELKLSGISSKEKQELQNSIDLYTVCLECAKAFKDQRKELSTAGLIIGNMVAKGAFDSASKKEAGHQENVKAIINEIAEQISTKSFESKNLNPEFTQWWNENIMERNDVYFGKDGSTVSTKINDVIFQEVGKDVWEKLWTDEGKGVEFYKNDPDPENWRNDTDLSNLLTQCSKYFIYLYFTEEELNKLPDVFREKRNKQLEVYWFVSDKFLGVYGDQDDLDRIIYTGIVQDTGKTPREICSEVVSGARDPESVGEITVAIAMIIVAGISAILAIITAIINAIAKTQQVKYTMMQNAEEGAASEDDFNGLTEKMTLKQKRTLLGVAAGLIGIMLLLKNK